MVNPLYAGTPKEEALYRALEDLTVDYNRTKELADDMADGMKAYKDECDRKDRKINRMSIRLAELVEGNRDAGIELKAALARMKKSYILGFPSNRLEHQTTIAVEIIQNVIDDLQIIE